MSYDANALIELFLDLRYVGDVECRFHTVNKRCGLQALLDPAGVVFDLRGRALEELFFILKPPDEAVRVPRTVLCDGLVDIAEVETDSASVSLKAIQNFGCVIYGMMQLPQGTNRSD